MTPPRIALISVGTITAALLLAHGAWIVLIACVAALDTEQDPA